MIALNALQKTDIKSVYTGRAGKCCCGCAGTHSEKPATKTYVLNILKKNAADVDDDGDNLSVEIGGRLYVAYRTQEAQNAVQNARAA
ncbi:hypothetical protein [Hyphomicrobium sp.]|uniref:hypothetical protein n=1 Tax=Hyphomicrobium sp. TaxID=82 RepID=UPI001DBF5582|nr:hypothetical protein [Hyphomicrobium sp.]MBY0560051.1 hypothetical protein [Hyphomicrobium sp.]